VTGRRGCLGRLVLLVLLAWPIGELAQIVAWSDTTTGGLFLVVLTLLVIGGSAPRGSSGTVRIVRAPAAPEPSLASTPGDRIGPRSNASLGSPSSRPGRTLTRGGVPRARDPLPARLRFRILGRDGFRCRYCGRPGDAPGVVLHVDHVVPVAAGGTTSEDNLRTACEECNLGKGTRAVVASER
jgi:5-methylcytosine-specific restriction endonuclease McrA